MFARIGSVIGVMLYVLAFDGSVVCQTASFEKSLRAPAAEESRPRKKAEKRKESLAPRSKPSQLPGRGPEQIPPEKLRLDDRAFLAA